MLSYAKYLYLGKMIVMYLVNIYWGNDDAHSAIKIKSKTWGHILLGEAFTKVSWGYYEGRRFSVTWTFNQGLLTIQGPDGMVPVIDRSILTIDVEQFTHKIK